MNFKWNLNYKIQNKNFDISLWSHSQVGLKKYSFERSEWHFNNFDSFFHSSEISIFNNRESVVGLIYYTQQQYPLSAQHPLQKNATQIHMAGNLQSILQRRSSKPQIWHCDSLSDYCWPGKCVYVCNLINWNSWSPALYFFVLFQFC